MKVTNAKTLPKVYYGLHMVEGVAEYKEGVGDAFRIFIGEKTIKNMDSTFSGRPVYVHHVDDVNLENLQNEADGYVVESFFNKLDGKHWAKFIIVSDRGHEAIRNGWKLSNAYILKKTGLGGTWHGVDYNKEVVEGEYEHLAIVPNPRYQESVIFTPEQFKTYNQEKENHLTKLANSEQTKKGVPMFNFFKKQKAENSDELQTLSVILPKSKKEVEISTLINSADEAEMKKGDKVFANGDHMVKVGEEEMSVNALVEKYNAMCSKNSESEQAENISDEDAKKKALELAAHEEDEMKKAQSSSDKDADDVENVSHEESLEAAKKIEKHEEESIAEDKAKNSNFNKLKNAPERAMTKASVVELSSDRVARGKSRYGSK